MLSFFDQSAQPLRNAHILRAVLLAVERSGVSADSKIGQPLRALLLVTEVDLKNLLSASCHLALTRSILDEAKQLDEEQRLQLSRGKSESLDCIADPGLRRKVQDSADECVRIDPNFKTHVDELMAALPARSPLTGASPSHEAAIRLREVLDDLVAAFLRVRRLTLQPVPQQKPSSCIIL